MFPAFFLLVLLIIGAPITIIFDGPIIYGLVTAVAAISVAIVSVRMRPGEASFLSTVIWPAAVVAVIPVFWMLIQVLPLQQLGLAHPIWESAAAALGRPLAGSISIDPGATLISFVRYLSVAAIAFVAAAVAVDRRRAEWVLFALVGATTMIALMVLVSGVGGFTVLNYSSGGLAGDAAADSAGLGAVLACAAALHMFEHGKTQRPDQAGLTGWYWPALVACIVAIAICSLALILGATSRAYFAVTCGIVTLAAAMAIRHFNLGPWGIAAIASITIFVAVAVVILQPGNQSLDLTLAFAAQAPSSLIAVTQRVLLETSWAGTGAGTFAAILPIYQDIDELATRSIAPTTAAAIAVEMGRPFLWAVLVAAVALIVMLLHGALRRLRDSLYSAAGASCVVTITVLAFSNAVLSGMPVLLIAAGVVGLAIAQSRSRLI